MNENKLEVFQNQEFGSVRIVEIDGDAWLVGKDVAQALGYSNTKDALATHVDDEDKRILQRSEIATFENHIPQSVLPINFVSADIPNRGLTVINESGLYSLVLSSKLPNAKKFRRWVTSEVIPSIKRHGAYITPETLQAAILNPDTMIQLCQQLKAEQDRNAQLKAENSALVVQNQIAAPKAEYFDALVDRNLLTNFRQTAKELGVKEREFVSFLLAHKYIYRDKAGHLLPYSARNDGLFEIKECFNDKTSWKGTQTLITPKGRETFRLLCVAADKK